MAAPAKTPEYAWEAKLTWSIDERECLRDVPDDPDAGEAEQEERRSPEAGKPKRVKEVVVLTILVCFVDFLRPKCERMRFRVTRLKNGGFTFSDPRGRYSGTLGTTGLWGTLPPLPPVRPQSLTPRAFKVEAARYIGADRAEEIIQEIKQSPFFSAHL